MQNVLSSENITLDHSAAVQSFLSLAQATLLTLSVVQEWLDTRNATVEAHVQLYGDADFIFQQDLAPAHSAKATSTWFKDHGIPVLNWPANSPDLKPIEILWGIVKRKMRYARPNNAEELKAAIRATWASITPQECHRLIDSMPRRIAAVIQAKGAPTKY